MVQIFGNLLEMSRSPIKYMEYFTNVSIFMTGIAPEKRGRKWWENWMRVQKIVLEASLNSSGATYKNKTSNPSSYGNEDHNAEVVQDSLRMATLVESMTSNMASTSDMLHNFHIHDSKVPHYSATGMPDVV